MRESSLERYLGGGPGQLMKLAYKLSHVSYPCWLTLGKLARGRLWRC
jgi:hypothetical protein